MAFLDRCGVLWDGGFLYSLWVSMVCSTCMKGSPGPTARKKGPWSSSLWITPLKDCRPSHTSSAVTVDSRCNSERPAEQIIYSPITQKMLFNRMFWFFPVKLQWIERPQKESKSNAKWSMFCFSKYSEVKLRNRITFYEEKNIEVLKVNYSFSFINHTWMISGKCTIHRQKWEEKQ